MLEEGALAGLMWGYEDGRPGGGHRNIPMLFYSEGVERGNDPGSDEWNG